MTTIDKRQPANNSRLSTKGKNMSTSKAEGALATSKGPTMVVEGDDSKGRKHAKAALSPAVNAAMAVHSYQRNLLGDDLAPKDLVNVLKAETKQIQDGDLSSLEAMLMGQATALQSIFTSLVRRAQIQTQQRNLEAFLSLGLKAQAQSRATIQALAELKFPRQVAFVKQTNVAHGPQQVNNHVGVAPAKEKQTQQTELLEDGVNGNTYLDTGTTEAAGRSDKTLEALGEIDRPANRRRKAAR